MKVDLQLSHRPSFFNYLQLVLNVAISTYISNILKLVSKVQVLSLNVIYLLPLPSFKHFIHVLSAPPITTYLQVAAFVNGWQPSVASL